MCAKRLKLARHVGMIFDTGIPKHTLEGGLGGRRPTGKLRNRWEGKMQKDGMKLPNMKNWHAMARCRSDCGTKTGGNGHEMG
jgi:hypothetical protein